ncbi:MAG: hypothetical protein OXR62_03460 [Ahrensia sp.]|nr:hypothetical protein [Ahrensia sp.]
MRRTLSLLLISLFFAGGAIKPLDTAIAQSRTQTLDDLMPQSSQPTLSKRDITGRVTIFDSVLVHPMPDWLPKEIQANPIRSTKINRSRDERSLLLEMIPREETFEDWRNLYTIIGFRDYPGDNASHARAIMRQFRDNCSPSNLMIGPLQGNPRLAMLVTACGSFARQRDMGEVAAFVLLQNGKTVARLAREWRGPAFRSEDPNQWPVSRASIQRIIQTMTRASLTTSPLTGDQ